MALLIPLAIFLIICVAMIVVLYKSSEPSSIDTIEAYCDAVLNKDLKIQNDLLITNANIINIEKIIEPLRVEFSEIGKKYPLEILKTLENLDTSIDIVVLSHPLLVEELEFVCQYFSNQWLITKIKVKQKI